MIDLTTIQQTAVSSNATSFLLGAAGTGKTTVLQRRLQRLLAEGEPAYTILTLIAEPGQQDGFLTAVRLPNPAPHSELKVITYNRMAQEMVFLFWPLVAREAGFARPYRPPTALSYDLAQLFMWRIISPMLAEGAFHNLRLRPQQIVSQILDTLNRAALNGLGLDEAIERQIATWIGEPERILHLQDAAKAARRFRDRCLEQNLLDLSLMIEVFDVQLVRHPEFYRYFSERYRHLIVDNVEEQTPAGQNFIHKMMSAAESVAIAYDAGGGYKRFMAADPTGANKFRNRCHRAFDFDENFVSAPEMEQLANVVENHLMRVSKPTAVAREAIIRVVDGRYRREMIANLTALLREIVDEGTPTHQIAIIAPYLDGALRYSLTGALKEAGLPYRLLRRRSSPREEPRIRGWLTWLALARREWRAFPTAYDVAEALTLTINGLDPVRAALLSKELYHSDTGRLIPVDNLPAPLIPRIGAATLALYEELRLWLAEAAARLPIDRFLHDLFAQLLSQRRFQPEPDRAGAAVCDWLVKAAARLQTSAAALGLDTRTAVGLAFLDGIYQGLVTANPPELGDPPDPDGIMISTIYGYLLAGESVGVQVWLETAATGWWDIPNQPLSNAFVLAQSWSGERPWTMDEDFAIRNQLLSRIVRGLCARCSDGVVLANSDLDRRGVRQEGMLWKALGPARTL